MPTVILQARMGSTRLPGKSLMPILNRPMLWYTVATLKRSSAIDRIVLAIPEGKENDALADFAEVNEIHCFRGSESNVLERFYLATLIYRDDYYFRATGDNPILDYNNPGRSLNALKTDGLDYVVESGMPLGSVVEAFTSEALERAFKEGHSAEDLEHVTWYMKKSGKFNIRSIEAPTEFNFPKLRLTVDYPEDFDRVQSIIENLYQDSIPPFKDIVAFARSLEK